MESVEGEPLLLLTVPDAAKRSGAAETTIRNAMRRGRLPYREMYGRKLIAAADLLAYRATARRGRPKKQKPPLAQGEVA